MFKSCLCCKHGPFADDFSREVAVDFADFSRLLDLGEAELRSSEWICSPPLPGLVNIQKAIEHGHFKLIYTSKMGVFHSKHVSLPEGIGVVYPNMGGSQNPAGWECGGNPSTSKYRNSWMSPGTMMIFPHQKQGFHPWFPMIWEYMRQNPIFIYMMGWFWWPRSGALSKPWQMGA